MEIVITQVANGWIILRGGNRWVAQGRDEMLQKLKELIDVNQ